MKLFAHVPPGGGTVAAAVGLQVGSGESDRMSCDWSMMSCRNVSRVRKKFALMRKLEDTTGTPCVPVHPHEGGFRLQAELTA